MTRASEITSSNALQMAGALQDGLTQLDYDQELLFQIYDRSVLPIDAFVYWIPSRPATFKGALHYSQEIVQNEDETYGAVTVTFTSREPIAEFSTMPTNTLYVATIEDPAGGMFRFAFSRQQGFFQQSGLWHYQGHSIPPALASQFLDTQTNKIDLAQAVVSNSLPFWLQLNGYTTPLIGGFDNAGTPFLYEPPQLFPAGLVDPNRVPPYGEVHIPEDTTEALQAAPYLDKNRGHFQLVRERVIVTLYGLQNNAVLDFVDLVNQYTLSTGNFGLMNSPVPRDAYRTQAEIQARAMKKSVVFEINYNQARLAQVTRQLILSCVPQIYLNGFTQPVS